jgi:hypothetical protein
LVACNGCWVNNRLKILTGININTAKGKYHLTRKIILGVDKFRTNAGKVKGKRGKAKGERKRGDGCP